MQAVKSLELRIPAECMHETAFQLLAESLQTLGTAMETDVDLAQSTHIAWFEASADETGQYKQIATALMHHGVAQDNISINILDSTDWETAWQKDWQAMPIGEKLLVRPSFCQAPTDGRIDIVLDPGMAFGTGTHPTTRLCLEAIERVCVEKPSATVLDMGAGSGILAITALKLGAGSALAIDMEEESVEACKTNADINGVDLDIKLGEIPPNQTFDLVVANILAGPLVWMAKELAACVDGHLVLSGLLTTQIDDVIVAYIAEGLTEVRRDTLNEWASVELNRSRCVHANIACKQRVAGDNSINENKQGQAKKTQP